MLRRLAGVRARRRNLRSLQSGGPAVAGHETGPEQSRGTVVRRARLEDAPAIARLIAHYAAQGLLLPRSEQDIAAGIGRFHVLKEGGRVLGCVALETYGPDLAEIRSLAIDAGARGGGLGSRLVRAALAQARRRKIARVFAVTHAPEFFARHGFTPAPRAALPEKLERDCARCPRAQTCRLVAVVAVLCPERLALPVVDAASPVPAH
jgi:N-acetylglutamate synthase-like GNAT family acetyltransferase